MKQLNLIVLLMFFIYVTISLDAQETQERSFTTTTAEGITLTFIIIDEAERKVAVGTGKKFVPAMQTSVQGRFTIPDEVNGYKVTQIGAYAFIGCQLDSVIIPEGIDTIAQDAFSCKKLKYVSIPSSVKKICCYAFFIEEDLTTVISHIQNPQNTMEESAFDEWVAVDSKQRRMEGYGPTWLLGNYQKATLYVPHGTKSLYQNTFEWRNFSNIVEIETTDISSVQDAKKNHFFCFGLTGRPLMSPPSKGIYIQNGKKYWVK